jgi:hypothetical protein
MGVVSVSSVRLRAPLDPSPAAEAAAASAATRHRSSCTLRCPFLPLDPATALLALEAAADTVLCCCCLKSWMSFSDSARPVPS